jgi:hypothetical protein
MKLEAARRLLTATLLTESRVVLRAVIECLRKNGHTAEYTDDDQDMVVVRCDLHDCVDTLDAYRWTVKNEQILDGGLYTSGKTVIMTGGPFDLKLMQTSPGRVVICQDK